MDMKIMSLAIAIEGLFKDGVQGWNSWLGVQPLVRLFQLSRQLLDMVRAI
jgi:hypothetical protein